MSLRTYKVSGIVTLLFGIGVIGFSAFGLMIVALQTILVSTMPPIPKSPYSARFLGAMQALHNTWLFFLPLLMIGGITFACAGYYTFRGSIVARRIAQATAICSYIWLVGYSVSCAQVVDGFSLPPGLNPDVAMPVLRWVTIVFGILLSAVFPTSLLYILSRSHEKEMCDLQR
jgi:hypothetical protein